KRALTSLRCIPACVARSWTVATPRPGTASNAPSGALRGTSVTFAAQLPRREFGNEVRSASLARRRAAGRGWCRRHGYRLGDPALSGGILGEQRDRSWWPDEFAERVAGVGSGTTRDGS